jgi:poly(A) polymerase
VRVIRAVRFAAKLSGLGFKMEAKTAAPLKKAAKLLADVPQSRLFDEMLKLLQTGHALASIEQLKLQGLAKGIYPLLDIVVARSNEEFVTTALNDTDRRVGEDKPVAPSFLLACVLWSDVRETWALRSVKQPSFPALQDAIDEVFDTRIGDVSGRGKLGADMREIWMMQPRFEKRTGSGPWTLVDQSRFRAGFDFMRLRADVGEVDEALSDWWQEFSMASDSEREDLLQQVRQEQQQQKTQRAPRVHAVRRAPKPEAEDPRFRDVAPDGVDVGEDGAESPAKKRRRRRRKPTGEAGGAPTAE